MKCPHCGYDEAKYDEEGYYIGSNEHGHFYKLPIEVKRSERFFSEDVKIVYGCPNPECRIVFIEE